MAKYAVNSESLTAVADAIRAKTGGTDLLLFPDGMVEAIEGMSGGDSSAFGYRLTPTTKTILVGAIKTEIYKCSEV